MQPATGLWCTGNTCPRQAAGETGGPKYCLHPPWFRASCSCVQVPFMTRWTRAKARIWSLSLVVCYRRGVTHVLVSLPEPDLEPGWTPRSVALLVPVMQPPVRLLGMAHSSSRSAPDSLPRLAAADVLWLVAGVHHLPLVWFVLGSKFALLVHHHSLTVKQVYATNFSLRRRAWQSLWASFRNDMHLKSLLW